MEFSVVWVDVVSGAEVVLVVSEDDVVAGDIDVDLVEGNIEELESVVTDDLVADPLIGSLVVTLTLLVGVGCDRVLLSFVVVFPLNIEFIIGPVALEVSLVSDVAEESVVVPEVPGNCLVSSEALLVMLLFPKVMVVVAVVVGPVMLVPDAD